MLRNGKASIVGSPDVCDYLDFITSSGKETEFFSAILDDLRKRGINTLELEPLRPDSYTIRYLIPLLKNSNYEVSYNQSDVSLDIELPSTWEYYLSGLEGKQRHELKRKIRNLHKAGEVSYHVIEEAEDIPGFSNLFLKLFPDYRRDKAEFMTSEMQTFFRTVAEELSKIGVIKFGVLDLGHKAVAMIMYFDYKENMYLYNSAYDPEFRSLSVGIVNKARCIQDGIQRGKKRFDFLKGSEQYKYYLGGKEIPLFKYVISFNM